MTGQTVAPRVATAVGESLPERIWYGDGLGARAARAALVPGSLVFGAAVAARGLLYDRGWLPSARVEAPVVSVGGLRVGGAGKTPMVLWLAKRLRRQGLRVCLVTRGYGRRTSTSTPFLLGWDPHSTALAESVVAMAGRAGDEATLLLLRSGCRVVVGSDRVAACRTAFREMAAAGGAPDLFLLDDGFQHRALDRVFDIVMVDGCESSQRLLPAGPLRESVAALERAHAVVAVVAPSANIEQGIDLLSTPRWQFRAEVLAEGLVSLPTDTQVEALAALRGARVVAVAGIARPRRFLDEMARAGANIVGVCVRPDHHWYGPSDVAEIRALAAAADFVVTTEKDLVKLATTELGAPLRGLRIEMDVRDAEVLLAPILALRSFDH